MQTTRGRKRKKQTEKINEREKEKNGACEEILKC